MPAFRSRLVYVQVAARVAVPAWSRSVSTPPLPCEPVASSAVPTSDSVRLAAITDLLSRGSQVRVLPGALNPARATCLDRRRQRQDRPSLAQQLKPIPR